MYVGVRALINSIILLFSKFVRQFRQFFTVFYLPPDTLVLYVFDGYFTEYPESSLNTVKKGLQKEGLRLTNKRITNLEKRHVAVEDPNGCKFSLALVEHTPIPHVNSKCPNYWFSEEWGFNFHDRRADSIRYEKDSHVFIVPHNGNCSGDKTVYTRINLDSFNYGSLLRYVESNNNMRGWVRQRIKNCLRDFKGGN